MESQVSLSLPLSFPFSQLYGVVDLSDFLRALRAEAIVCLLCFPPIMGFEELGVLLSDCPELCFVLLLRLLLHFFHALGEHSELLALWLRLEVDLSSSALRLGLQLVAFGCL